MGRGERHHDQRRGRRGVVADYRYNGLGYRTSWTGFDTITYHICYDDRWRPVATFRGSDSSAKERFVWHNAGADGLGGSSYIDLAVLRDKDANTAWSAASDGTLEDRIYYCQNWRADVSVIVSSGGQPIEWIKYSAYGVPSSYALGDHDLDGDIDSADDTSYQAAIGSSGPGKRDLDFDGDEAQSADDDAFYASYNAASTGGRGVLSRAATANRIGYAGYQWEPSTGLMHVRHRAYKAELGRWLQRAHPGYSEQSNLRSTDDQALVDPLSHIRTQQIDRPSDASQPFDFFRAAGCETSIQDPKEVNRTYKCASDHSLRQNTEKKCSNPPPRNGLNFVCIRCSAGCEIVEIETQVPGTDRCNYTWGCQPKRGNPIAPPTGPE
jgi:RHS repeat-associated protein